MPINTKSRIIQHSKNEDGWNQEVYNFCFEYEFEVYQQNKIIKIVDHYIKDYALTYQDRLDWLEHDDARWRIVKYKKTKTKNDNEWINWWMFWEAILFNILKAYFPEAKKLVTKIRMRTAMNTEVHWFDCAHYTYNKEGNELILRLWEAKFYSDFSSALNEAYKSIVDHLNSAKIKEEFVFLTPDLEIVDEEEKKIVRNIMEWTLNNITFFIPILLTYDTAIVKKYKTSEEFLSQEQKDYQKKWKSILKKEFSKINMKINVFFKFILLPFEDVQSVKEKFIQKRDSYDE